MKKQKNCRWAILNRMKKKKMKTHKLYIGLIHFYDLFFRKNTILITSFMAILKQTFIALADYIHVILFVQNCNKLVHRNV
jgi:hypothetical protein